MLGLEWRSQQRGPSLTAPFVLAYTRAAKSGLTRASSSRARVERDEKRALALRRDLYRMRASVCFEFSEYYKCLYIIIIECYYSLCQRFDLLHLVLDRLARISGSWRALVFFAGVSLLAVFGVARHEPRLTDRASMRPI